MSNVQIASYGEETTQDRALYADGPTLEESSERRTRMELAALYRLVALHGWDDGIYTHISARIPGSHDHFLINPFGLYFEEITASSLVKVDVDGRMLESNGHVVNPAGFTIHSAVHMARPDASFVVHLHTDAGVAVSCQRNGLLPLSQHSLIVRPMLAYHDYEGIALRLDERERIVADLGDKKLLLLRNHGTMAVGETAAQAWTAIYHLEKACQQQIGALTGGIDGLLTAARDVQEEVGRQVRAAGSAASTLAWPGLLRRLDRHLPGYDS